MILEKNSVTLSASDYNITVGSYPNFLYPERFDEFIVIIPEADHFPES